MTRPKFYLIDGHSFAYRAFYAMPASMMTKAGQPTNALYGFAKMIISIIEEKKPAAIAVAFDLPQPTFRHEAYKEYKAHRPPSPDEFRSQIPLIKEWVVAMGIPVVEQVGYEADDVLATMATQAVHAGYKAIIVTGDRDALQLVSEHLHVLIPVKGVSEMKEFDVAAVEQKYEGLKPEQIIDLKALMGDSSDNIPGVKGIGEKTAIALLQEFHSIDGLYAAIERVPREVVRNKLIEQESGARQSYMLAKVITNVPLTVSLESCAFAGVNWSAIVPFFKKYELYSLAKGHEPEPEQTGLFFEKPVLDKDKLLQARIMKHLLHAERPLKDEDITAEDIADIPQLTAALKEQGLWRLYDEIEFPLAAVLQELTDTGVKVDIGLLAKMSKELEQFMAGLEKAIYVLAGQEFNINSPKQLGEIFFEKLQLPSGKKTKTGYSTDASVLEELAYSYPIAQKILEYRQMAKLKSTYVDALPLLINPKTGLIHTTYNQTVVATGRLSSVDPNLQNIPIRSELGKKIRAAFIPRKAGNVILTADYSQIELRILAHYADEQKLIDAYAKNLDIHSATAAYIFGVPLESVTADQRSQAKAVNFGIAYGMSARRLAQTVGISYADAQSFIDKYFENYPGIKRYMDDTIALAKRQGYVTTLFGRRRHFPEIHAANKNIVAMAERAAINMPIQGTSADIIKVAMLRIHEEIAHQKMKAHMILQVHDELVFDVPEHEVYDLECLLKRIMCSVYELKVPLIVNTASGANWLEAK